MTTLTNKLGLPDALVRAVKAFEDDYDPGDSDATVTEIIGPPQLATLRRKHAEEIEEDVSDRIWALLGQVVHDILRRANVSDLVESRYATEVLGWKVSGQFDRLSLMPGEGGFAGLLQDYKVASVWEAIYGVKPERTQQLNLLAEILRRNGFNIGALEIVFIFRDWKKSEARRDPQYPQVQVLRQPISLWTSSQATRFLEQRVRVHQDARNSGILPECSEEDRWARGTRYAVMKPGGKRAVKLCDTMQEAKQHAATIKGAYVTVRLGESIRCTGYCPVKDFCPQYRQISAATGGEEEN
jgi:hypothetical protein